MSFTRAEQPVVKNEIDLFGVLLNKKSVRLDFYFLGTLHKFNLPFIQNQWENGQAHLLDLP